MTYTDAVNLMCEYTKSEALRKHMYAVETAMRAYARKFGEDEETWAMVGVLHDFDYEKYPTIPEHPLMGSEILKKKDILRMSEMRYSAMQVLQMYTVTHRWQRFSTPATNSVASSLPLRLSDQTRLPT